MKTEKWAKNISKAQVRELRRQNKRWPFCLIDIPEDQWPTQPEETERRSRVMRSCDFLVQIFEPVKGATRMTVLRTDWDLKQARWVEGITWEDLQRLKADAGFADHCAIEIFPPENHVVNVANMRHLWILPEPPEFMWTIENGSS